VIDRNLHVLAANDTIHNDANMVHQEMSKSILLHEDHTNENVGSVIIKIQCVHSILYGKLRTSMIMVIKIGREKSCQ
jgi:hypothetical protein